MPNRQYQAGKRFEWAVRDRLYAAGFDLVVLSAGSKTKVDVIGLSDTLIVLIQAKAHGVISPAERTALTSYAAPFKARGEPLVALVAYKGTRGQGIQFDILDDAGKRQPWSLPVKVTTDERTDS